MRGEGELCELAGLHGVLTGYADRTGRWQKASPEPVLAVLRELGVGVGAGGARDVRGALREGRLEQARRVLEPAVVHWRGRPLRLPLRWPEGGARGVVRCTWDWEDGGSTQCEHRWERLRVQRRETVEGERFVQVSLPGPARTPVGYHGVTVEVGGSGFRAHVFSAPERCFEERQRERRWGVFAPLYAVPSARSWGAGDYTDLEAMVRWVAGRGGRCVATLPLLSCSLGRPGQPSPYSPLSRLFWNEFFVDVERAPEWAGCPAARRLVRSDVFRGRMERWRASAWVDYEGIMAAKREVLEVLGRRFFARASARRRALEEAMRTDARLAAYVRFRAARDAFAGTHEEWIGRLSQGPLREDEAPVELRRHHAYAQWLAREQMTGVAAAARESGACLYLDLPVGTDPAGFDAWHHREVFVSGAVLGAPPDPGSPKGQVWGLAPLHPVRDREQGHAYLRACLGHHLEHARMLRCDHVAGLHRLYWIPAGFPASAGVYVRYPADELYAVLSIASHRHRATLVGENLGTLPEELAGRMRRHRLPGMHVVQEESPGGGRQAWRRPPVRTVASVNNHDLPMFAAFWEGRDLAEAVRLGRMGKHELRQAQRERVRLCRAISRKLGLSRGRVGGVAEAGEALRALVLELGRSRARWVLVNLEDLWLERTPQNTPGTLEEAPNWRHKVPFPREVWTRQGGWLEVLDALGRARRGLRVS